MLSTLISITFTLLVASLVTISSASTLPAPAAGQAEIGGLLKEVSDAHQFVYRDRAAVLPRRSDDSKGGAANQSIKSTSSLAGDAPATSSALATSASTKPRVSTTTSKGNGRRPSSPVAGYALHPVYVPLTANDLASDKSPRDCIPRYRSKWKQECARQLNATSPNFRSQKTFGWFVFKYDPANADQIGRKIITVMAACYETSAVRCRREEGKDGRARQR